MKPDLPHDINASLALKAKLLREATELLKSDNDRAAMKEAERDRARMADERCPCCGRLGIRFLWQCPTCGRD